MSKAMAIPFRYLATLHQISRKWTVKSAAKSHHAYCRNSQLPEEPKNPDESNDFWIYRACVSAEEQQIAQINVLSKVSVEGMPKMLFEKSTAKFALSRYNELMANPKELEEIPTNGRRKSPP